MTTEVECPMCMGSHPALMGSLGSHEYYRCRFCGATFNKPTEKELTRVDVEKISKEATKYVRKRLRGRVSPRVKR